MSRTIAALTVASIKGGTGFFPKAQALTTKLAAHPRQHTIKIIKS